MKPLKKKLEEMLLESNKVTKEQLSHALRMQKEKNASLKDILIEQGFISEKDLVTILSQGLSIPPITLSKFSIAPELLHLIPEHIIRKYNTIPVAKIGKCLTVAMADPLSVELIDCLLLIS